MAESNQINLETISAIEANIISCINSGVNTFEEMQKKLECSEAQLTYALSTLINKQVLKLEIQNNQEVYVQQISLSEDDYVVLDGNILLPCNIVKIPERGIMYIMRGNIYEVPIDFDTRRIIWNIKFVEKNSSSLAELIRSSILKERKGKIKHLPEYDMLKNKIVPYSKDIGLILTSIGEELTTVNIVFKINFNNAFNTCFNGFTVQSEIKTEELINELQKQVENRDYQKNIELNKLFTIEDFIFAKNEIPIALDGDILQYIRFTGLRSGYEITYYEFNTFSQATRKIEVETFDTYNELKEKVQNYFEHYAGQILANSDFYVEVEV